MNTWRKRMRLLSEYTLKKEKFALYSLVLRWIIMITQYDKKSQKYFKLHKCQNKVNTMCLIILDANCIVAQIRDSLGFVRGGCLSHLFFT